ncbi:MAG: hypothetical protein PHD01_15165 [Geobacteraceae bacterium]|nr:hypothetical protein [Geobacteraceae bacterium]
MHSSTKPVYTEKVRQRAISSTYPVLYDLLEVCKSMLPLIKETHPGTPENDSIVKDAERAIARAESELNRGWKKHPLHNAGYFGRLGNHYDFEIHVDKVQDRVRAYRCVGRDRMGRLVIVQIQRDEEPLPFEAGESMFFRGKVQAHRLLYGEPVTYIEATSGVLKV